MAVYFIQCRQRVKIGFTTDLRKRLEALQIAATHQLKLIGCVEGSRDLEKKFHSKLRQFRVRGEWFKKCPEVMDVIRDALDALPRSSGEKRDSGAQAPCSVGGYGFGKMSKQLWPQKTPASIVFYTGMPERTARHVAAEKSDPSSIELVKIIDSDQGWRALEWIMRDSKQKWWLELRRHAEIGRQTEQNVASIQQRFSFDEG